MRGIEIWREGKREAVSDRLTACRMVGSIVNILQVWSIFGGTNQDRSLLHTLRYKIISTESANAMNSQMATIAIGARYLWPRRSWTCPSLAAVCTVIRRERPAARHLAGGWRGLVGHVVLQQVLLGAIHKWCQKWGRGVSQNPIKGREVACIWYWQGGGSG